MNDNEILLFRYLSMAMPYNVKISKVIEDYVSSPQTIHSICVDGVMIIEYEPATQNFPADIDCWHIGDVKPYLRSMEDMTDEEYEELKSLCSIYIPSDSRNIGFEDYGVLVFTQHFNNDSYTFKLNNMNVINWLLKKKFDFMGFIEKGLALKVTKKNNPYENY